LKYLDLKYNSLDALPDDLSVFSNLDTFDIQNNAIRSLPGAITELTATTIILRNNLICNPAKETLAWLRAHYNISGMIQRCQSFSFQEAGEGGCFGELYLDFSATPGRQPSPTDSCDVIMGYGMGGYLINAPNGVISLGVHDPWALSDSLTVPEIGYQNQYIMDTLYTLYAVKTLEGNYALIMCHSYWPGGCDHHYFAWSYNPDGTRMFVQDVPVAVINQNRPETFSVYSVRINENQLLVYVKGADAFYSAFSLKGRKIKSGTKTEKIKY
jgi:hypothetical protein